MLHPLAILTGFRKERTSKLIEDILTYRVIRWGGLEGYLIEDPEIRRFCEDF